MTARSILVLLVTLAIASSSEWAVRYDGPANGANEARAIALSPDGIPYVAGCVEAEAGQPGGIIERIEERA